MSEIYREALLWRELKSAPVCDESADHREDSKGVSITAIKNRKKVKPLPTKELI
ncbi:MAG: hypothetical protein WCE81_02515 [Halobacteriota archaeon]